MRNPIKNDHKMAPLAWTVWGNLVTGALSTDHLRDHRTVVKSRAGSMLTIWGAVQAQRPGQEGKPRSSRRRSLQVRAGPKEGFGTVWDHPGQGRTLPTKWAGYEPWYQFNTAWGNFNFLPQTFPFRPPLLCVRERW